METMTSTADRIAELYVDPFPGRKGTDRVREACGYCMGTGVYEGKSGFKFHTPSVGYETTGCFRCHGTGHHSRLVSSARATARRQARKQAEHEAYLAENGERLRREAAEREAAERREAEAKAAAHAAIPAIEEGRYEVSGELLATKIVEGPYGSSLKMLLGLPTGAKLWGSFPSGLSGAQRGDSVRFTATIERASDDHAFGFYKRPTKASVL